MSSAAEIDPSVCYRHPDRQSWILCQRCGRTICPECQILAPVGVQCPECVREAGGSVQWRPAANRPARASRNSAAASFRRRPRWQVIAGNLLRPESSTPVLTWTISATVLLLWLVGFATQILTNLLFASPVYAVQIWRYFTSPFVFPSALNFQVILSLGLSLVFFMINAPSLERMMGRNRFLIVFFTGGAVGSVGMVLAYQPSYGLFGALYGLFGGLLIIMWSVPSARFQILIMIGLNVVISLLFGAGGLPELAGGIIGGAGATYLLRFFDDRSGSRKSTPYLIIGGSVALLIVIAIIRSTVAV